MEHAVASPKVRVRVQVLGELALFRSDGPVILPRSRKTRALLAYLLLTGRPQRRDRLCEIFWERPDDPRAALRWSLTKLRQSLGPDMSWIEADREHVACTADGAVIDLDEVRAAADEDEPLDSERLVALANKALEPALLGLDLSHSEIYSAWLAAERASADRVRAAVLKRAAALPELQPERRIRYLAALVEIGPQDEDARRRLDEARVSPVVSPEPDAPAEPAPARHWGHRQTVRYCFADDGARIAYACTGQGRPLVKAANWLNHLQLDWESPIWGELFHELSRDHQLVRYDERGNGLSQWEVADLSFDAFVADLEVVTDELELDRFPLLGISQGCAVSIEYASRHPERVTHLILIGGYAAGWRIDGDARMTAEREAAITLVRHGWGQDNPAYRQIFSNTFFPSATAGEIDWFNDFQKRITTPENAVRFLEVFSRIDVRHRLSALRQPVLVIHSREDQRVSLDHGIELASQIPRASLITLDSDSHLPLAREPASQEMIACIREFVGGQPVSGPWSPMTSLGGVPKPPGRPLPPGG